MVKPALPISMIGAALALVGCTIVNQPASLDSAVTPVSATRHGANYADAHYALGRYYQGQIRYDQAVQAYQAVLEAQPDHADAHNALGVVYAIQGRRDLAETELRAALRLAPGSAHIHNNLGYALLLQGRADEARSAFQEALRLDPSYSRAADNLRTALARLEESPAPVPVPSSAVKTVKAESPPPAASASENASESTEAGPAKRASAANVFEMQWPERGQESPTGRVAPAVPSQPTPLPARVEVANGNGVEGLARRTSAYLKGAGYGPVRLTNQKPFSQEQTEIQFRPGFEQQAKSLQKALAGKGVMASSSQMRQDIQVRLVLGKDLRTTEQLAEIEAGALRLARNDD